MPHSKPPTEDHKHDQNLQQQFQKTQPQRPGLTFNWEDWLPYFEDTDVPDAQKRELIETLWLIVVSFVDLGFDLNPHQKICGQTLDLKTLLDEAVLKSDAVENAHAQATARANSLPKKTKKQKEPNL